MIPQKDVKKVRELVKKGYTISQIANELNYTPDYIFSVIQTFNIEVKSGIESMWLNTKRWGNEHDN